MSLPTWPSSMLPAMALDVTVKSTPTLLRTDTTGAVFQRSQSRIVVKSYSVKWVFTNFQYALFQAFFRYKLKSGLSKFVSPFPTSAGLVDCTVRFSEPKFSTNLVGGLWSVTATIDLEVIAS